MAKDWPPEAAATAVRLLYRRVLERDADDSGLITFAGALDRGELSVRDIVRSLGKSDEYRNRFVVPFSLLQIARLMYLHFLARQAESEAAAKGWADLIATQGWQAAVDGFINSDEYSNRFGDDSVPA